MQARRESLAISGTGRGRAMEESHGEITLALSGPTIIVAGHAGVHSDNGRRNSIFLCQFHGLLSFANGAVASDSTMGSCRGDARCTTAGLL
jgi:hypothetical protein